MKSDLPRGVGRPARRALAEAGYTRLEQLTEVREAEILKLHGVGPKAVGEIRRALFDGRIIASEDAAYDAARRFLRQSEPPAGGHRPEGTPDTIASFVAEAEAAPARVPDEATAFAYRKRRIMVALGAIYGDREEETVRRERVEDFAAALYHGESGVYVGFLGDEGEDRVRAAYPGTTWERLTAVKARDDPGNLFRLNQNIPPKTGRS